MMPDTQDPPLFFSGSQEEHTRKVALITREILVGKTNNTASITLSVDLTLTTLTGSRYSADTVVNLSPRSASAAVAMAAGVVWVETHKGEVIVHHDSQPDTDRIFGAVFVG
jgi:hypothetical protein